MAVKETVKKIFTYKNVVLVTTFPFVLLSILLHQLAEVLLVPSLFFYKLETNPDLRDLFNLTNKEIKKE